jgi:hypothetical protein
MATCGCGAEIHPDRAEFLLETGKALTCMTCSSERPKVCFMDYGHKTAPSLVVVGTNSEAIRKAERAFRRAR